MDEKMALINHQYRDLRVTVADARDIAKERSGKRPLTPS